MNRLLPIAVLILAMWAPVAPAGAEDPSAVATPLPDRALLEGRVVAGPALEELVSYARLANPMIRAARAGFAAALGSSRAAGWWPDPSLSLEKSLDTDMWKTTLAQGIPLPGASGAASDAAAAAARAAGSDLAIVLRDQVRMVRESAWELVYLREAKRLAQGNRELLAQVVAAGETGFARGRDALGEVLRARSQAAQAEYDVLLLGELAGTETARLNSLLDRPASSTIGPLGGPLGAPSLPDFAFTPGEIERLAAENSGEVGRAKERVAQAEAMARATTYENLPMLEVGGSYEKGGAKSLMASLSLPLWFGRNAGRSAAARAEVERAQAEFSGAQAATRSEAREAFFRARNARRLLALYADTLLPQAARAMESSQALYRQGAGSYADMVESAAGWYNFQLTAARARSDYGKAAARLAALTEKPGASSALADSPAPATTLLAGETRPAPALSFDPDRGERLLASPSFYAPAETPGGSTSLAPTFTLARLQALALSFSPPVVAAEKDARAALSAYSQASELADLLRRYAAFSGAGQEAAMLTPSPGPLALQGRIVDAEVKAAVARREGARRDASTAAARAFWELAFNREAQKVAKAEEQRLAQVAASVAARYQAGEASFSDLADAEGAGKRAAADSAALRAEQGAREARVREVVGLPSSAEVGVPAVAPPATDDPGLPGLEKLALARSPDLLMRRAEVERMELMVQMGRREGSPGFSQNLSLSDNRFLGQTGGMGAEGGMPAPAPASAGLGSAWLRELDGRLAAAREGLRATEAETVSRVREEWSAFDRARREAALFERDLAPLARLSADSALRAFATGKGDLARAVMAENAAGQAELARERRRADLGIARAELIAAVGGPWNPAKETQP
jgi:outer membrane protein, heavy metal efflux system